MNTENKTAQDVQEMLQQGDFEQAVGVAKKVLVSDPNDVYCLSLVAQAEFNSGNLKVAKVTLKKALKLQPNEINLNRNLGIVYNKTGKFKKSVKQYIKGIEANKKHPEILLDILLLGISLFKIESKKGADIIEYAFSQSQALKNAYMNKQELPIIADASLIANHIVRDEKYKKQKKAIDELSLGFESSKTQRLNDFLDIFHGIKRFENVDNLQNPTYHAFPGLDPIPFYNSEAFSWSKILEDNWKDIKLELDGLYMSNSLVKPYIEGVTTGVEGLDKLADSLDWSSVHLIKAGKYNKKLLKKCPVTSKAIDQLPLPILDGNAPEVFLSVLKPGAEIKPHYGLSNIKLTVHLGLEIPNDCALRAGTETQEWEEGKVMIFDDSFEHEAWNRSEDERKVLILEVWHPDLTTLEIKGIQNIMELQHAISLKASKNSIKKIIKKAKQII